MKNESGDEVGRWLGRPLCYRYRFVQLMTLHVAVRDPQRQARWCWAFGMLDSAESEVLGAWSSSRDDNKPILDDLAERGVERIRIMCAFDAADCKPAPTSLQVDAHVSAANIAAQVAGGGKRRSLVTALAAAERMHRCLVGAVKRRAPFASERSAEAFIAEWLERADRCIDDLAPSVPRMDVPAKALPSPGAMHAAAH